MTLEITINDDVINLGLFDYNLAIAHGRSEVTNNPTASNVQITLRGDTGPQLQIADVVAITFNDVPRFTGTISDLNVSFISTTNPTAITSITAMGNLSHLGLVDVGASGWTEQSARQRVEAIMTGSGETLVNGGDANITLHTVDLVDAQPTTALDALQEVATWTGATFFDDPQGRIVFEDYGNRGQTTFAGIWSNQVGTWSDAAGDWASYPTVITATSMDAGAVVFAPTFTKTLEPLINDVTLTYLADAIVNQTDSASIAAYGRREFRLQTQIKDSTDATTRAGNIITAQANPLWNLGQISILMNELTDNQLDEALALVSGNLVTVTGLPASGPYSSYIGILEGWTDSYNNGQHVLTVSISDPRFSYQTLTWGEVTADLTWSAVDADAAWFEIVSNDSLVGA